MILHSLLNSLCFEVVHSFAPAKINLYLHITGRRDDGYHLLDSLVAFVNVGDVLHLEPSTEFIFKIEGPKASVLESEPHENNLVVRAVRKMAEEFNQNLDVCLTLTKNLPIAAGIGGGSSDAAAAMRLLAEHWKVPLSNPALERIAADLGQDVYCCLEASSCFLSGAGHRVEKSPLLPHTNIVLVNPGKPLPTAKVYEVYKASDITFSSFPRLSGEFKTSVEFASVLHGYNNDLAKAACQIMPEIKEVLTALSASANCQLARMSGSGATCFGIYPDRSAAKQAAARIFEEHPDWWVVHGFLPYKGSASKNS